MTLTNSTVSGNSTNSFNGGGIYSHVGKTLTLNNTTVTNNHANTFGGGVIYRGPFIVQNTIVAGNTAVSGGPDCFEFPGAVDSAAVFSSGYNLIGDGTACAFSPTALGDQVGTDLNPIDAVLGLLQDNGGPTSTHALLPGSPAINSGNPSGCTDSSGNLLGTDQRGVGRPQDLVCDIGAFEVTSTVVNSLADPGVGACDPTECTLREAIVIAGGVNGITFNVTGTIFLTDGALVVDDVLTITGPGGAGITVDGGGASQVFNITNGTVVISNLTVANGFSSSGGGIGIEDPANLTLINSTVRDNTANSIGGGIYNLGTLTLTNSTVSGNSTNSLDGGGIYSHVGKTLTLNNTTVTNNSANTVGGGVIYRGPFRLQNTIIAGNTALNGGPDCFEFGGTVFSSGYNLIGDGTTCDFSPTGSGDQVGTGLSPIDPRLELLQDNGGPTFTHALPSGSPTVDTGNPAGCTDSLGNPLGTDQRGASRPNGAICDIGAFESSISTLNQAPENTVPESDSGRRREFGFLHG